MKKLTVIVLLAFLGLSLNLKSQVPAWNWAYDSVAAIGGMITDASGNLYVANDFGAHFLKKLDNDAHTYWTIPASGDATSPLGKDYHHNIAFDLSGNIIVSGYFTSDSVVFGNVVLHRVTTVDMFVAKFTSTGNCIWAKSAAVGCIGNTGFHVACDNSGNIYVVGSYSALSLTIGTTTFTNPCTYNSGCGSGNGCPSMLVVKYDANGNPQWAKSSFAGIGTSYCYSVVTDAQGNVYVAGDFGPNRNSIVKYNSNGDTLWTQNDGGWHIAIDHNGDIYAADDKAGLKKFNPVNGNIVWSKSGTGSGDYEAVSVSVDAANNLYFTGGYKTSGITFGTYSLSIAGQKDIFIACYSSGGNVLWAKALGGAGNDILNASVSDPFGNVFAGGFFLCATYPSCANPTPLVFENDSLFTLAPGYNLFFAKLGDNTVSINNITNNNKISIYPNPSNGNINIDRNGRNAVLQVINALGEIVLTQPISSQAKVEIPGKGLFFVKIYDGFNLHTQKVIVQ